MTSSYKIDKSNVGKGRGQRVTPGNLAAYGTSYYPSHNLDAWQPYASLKSQQKTATSAAISALNKVSGFPSKIKSRDQWDDFQAAVAASRKAESYANSFDQRLSDLSNQYTRNWASQHGITYNPKGSNTWGWRGGVDPQEKNTKYFEDIGEKAYRSSGYATMPWSYLTEDQKWGWIQQGDPSLQDAGWSNPNIPDLGTGDTYTSNLGKGEQSFDIAMADPLPHPSKDTPQRPNPNAPPSSPYAPGKSPMPSRDDRFMVQNNDMKIAQAFPEDMPTKDMLQNLIKLSESGDFDADDFDQKAMQWIKRKETEKEMDETPSVNLQDVINEVQRQAVPEYRRDQTYPAGGLGPQSNLGVQDGDNLAFGGMFGFKDKVEAGPATTKSQGGAREAYMSIYGSSGQTRQKFIEKYKISPEDYLNLPQKGQQSSGTTTNKDMTIAQAPGDARINKIRSSPAIQKDLRDVFNSNPTRQNQQKILDKYGIFFSLPEAKTRQYNTDIASSRRAIGSSPLRAQGAATATSLDKLNIPTERKNQFNRRNVAKTWFNPFTGGAGNIAGSLGRTNRGVTKSKLGINV